MSYNDRQFYPINYIRRIRVINLKNFLREILIIGYIRLKNRGKRDMIMLTTMKGKCYEQ